MADYNMGNSEGQWVGKGLVRDEGEPNELVIHMYNSYNRSQ